MHEADSKQIIQINKIMKQTLEEAAKEAIHAHYNCNGKYP